MSQELPRGPFRHRQMTAQIAAGRARRLAERGVSSCSTREELPPTSQQPVGLAASRNASLQRAALRSEAA